MIISYGVRYSFGVFVKPMFVEYNWPMTIIQLGSSINLAMYAVTGVFTGWLLDRFAPRWIMIGGILATSAGLILASIIKTPLGLYLSYGVLVGAGTAGSGMVVTSVAIGKWFNRYRGLAIGISSMGIGVGTMLMAPLAGYIVKHYGWRNGFLFIGLLMLAVGIFISYFFMGKHEPGQIGLMPDGDIPDEDINRGSDPVKLEDKASLKLVLMTFPFWMLVFCNMCAVMTVMMTFNLQIAYAIHNGINELEAAAALGIIGISGSCGKFFFGWFSDRVGDAKYAASAGFGIMAIGMFVLINAKTVGILYSYALIYGFGYGSLAPVMPYMISERFGRQALGAAYGVLVFFATGLGGSAGPLLGGFIFDRTNSYDIGWRICMVALIIVAVAILVLKPNDRRFYKS
jgi:MFS family permease